MKHRLVFVCVAAFGGMPGVAAAQGSAGGASADPPSIDALTCVDGRASVCTKGAELTVSGSALDGVRRVVFLGGKGPHDDRSAPPKRRSDDTLVVTVPAAARTGPLALDGSSRRVRSRRVKLTKPVAAPAAPLPSAPTGAEVFPIGGAHTYGPSAANRFGGGHQGQDVFAECGTPLVAVGPGTVLKAATETNAGNYIVIQRQDGSSNAYMHMRDPTTLQEGAPVASGDLVGVVGETGRATGCHLHFELWTAPGWYQGGKPVDPVPALRQWDTTD